MFGPQNVLVKKNLKTFRALKCVSINELKMCFTDFLLFHLHLIAVGH